MKSSPTLRHSIKVLQTKHFSNGRIVLELVGRLLVLFLLLIPRLTTAQLMYAWPYQEMFDKADIVAIATPLSTNDTKEHTIPWGDLHVIGVNTQFDIHLVFKGPKDIKNLVVHHYRHVEHKVVILNAPQTVVFDLKPPRDMYLMFLVKEPDGRFAPVSGQDDPAAAFHILKPPRVAP